MKNIKRIGALKQRTIVVTVFVMILGFSNTVVILGQRTASSPPGRPKIACLIDNEDSDVRNETQTNREDPALDKWFKAEVQRLNREEGINARLLWCDGLNAFARGDNEILIGRDLAHVIKGAWSHSVDHQRMIYRFILGHEFAHLLQARRASTGTAFTTRELELQADMTGGAWAALSLKHEAQDVDWFLQSRGAITFTCLVGEQRWRDPETHGTRADRQSAFYMGLILMWSRMQKTEKRDGQSQPLEETRHRQLLSQIVISKLRPDLVAEVVSDPTGHSKRWNVFFQNLARSTENGFQSVPEAPGGIAAVSVSGESDSRSFILPVMTSVLSKSKTAIQLWGEMLGYMEQEFQLWASTFSSGQPKGGLASIRELDKAKAVSALGIKNATIKRFGFRQETPTGGIRISVMLLTVTPEGSPANEATDWLVVTASRGQPITKEERQAYLEKQTAAREKRREFERQYFDALSNEPFHLSKSRRLFFTRIAEVVAQSRSVSTALASIDSLTLPTGVVVGARSNDTSDGFRSFILSDSVDEKHADVEETQFSSHVSSAFDEGYSPIILPTFRPRSFFGDKQTEKVVALRALPAIPANTKAEIVGEDIFGLEETEGSENRRRKPRVGYVQLQLSSSEGKRYLLILYLLWSNEH